MALDRKDIKKRLKGLPRQSVIWFAFRAALRVQPYQGTRDLKDIWPHEPKRHVSGLFRALNLAAGGALLGSDWSQQQNKALTRAAGSAAYAYAAYAYAAYAAAAYAAAADYADSAAADYADSAARAADYAAYADSAYASDYASAAHTKAIEADLRLIETGQIPAWPPLWQGNKPEDFASLEKSWLEALDELGLGYWGRRYREWVEGRANERLITRALALPKTFLDHEQANIDQLMAYLEQEEQEEEGTSSESEPENKQQGTGKEKGGKGQAGAEKVRTRETLIASITLNKEVLFAFINERLDELEPSDRSNAEGENSLLEHDRQALKALKADINDLLSLLEKEKRDKEMVDSAGKLKAFVDNLVDFLKDDVFNSSSETFRTGLLLLAVKICAEAGVMVGTIGMLVLALERLNSKAGGRLIKAVIALAGKFKGLSGKD